MTKVATQKTNVTTIPAEMEQVVFTDYSKMLGMLSQLYGGKVLVVTYETDMLAKGKLKAGAKTIFINGLKHKVRKTIRMCYDYATVVEYRTDGEETAKGGNTWQQAFTINDKGKVRITALTVHKDDVESIDNDSNVHLKDNARAYLRYEPLTDEQVVAGFAKNDSDKYFDNDSKEVDKDKLKPFFYDRKPQIVKHRTLSMMNVISIKVDGVTHHIVHTDHG